MLLQTPFINIYREQCPNSKDLRWRSNVQKVKWRNKQSLYLSNRYFVNKKFALSDSYNNFTIELLILDIVLKEVYNKFISLKELTIEIQWLI